MRTRKNKKTTQRSDHIQQVVEGEVVEVEEAEEGHVEVQMKLTEGVVEEVAVVVETATVRTSNKTTMVDSVDSVVGAEEVKDASVVRTKVNVVETAVDVVETAVNVVEETAVNVVVETVVNVVVETAVNVVETTMTATEVIITLTETENSFAFHDLRIILFSCAAKFQHGV